MEASDKSELDVRQLEKKLMFHKPKDIPSWLPVGAVVAFEGYRIIFQEITFSNGPFFEHYKRALFSLEASPFWERFKGSVPEEDLQLQGIRLSLAIRHSFPGIKDSPLSPVSAEEWKKELLSVLARAEQLAYRTPDNFLEWVAKLTDRLSEDVYWNFPNEDHRTLGRVYIPYPHNIFRFAIEALESSEYRQGPYSLKPNSETADRTYFVRSLTSFFLLETGRPQRRMVAEIASLAFSCELAESHVRRIAKGIDSEEKFYMFHRVGASADEILSEDYLNE